MKNGRRRFVARLGVLIGLLALVALPLLAFGTYERVAIVRVGLPVAGIAGYRVSVQANLDGGLPVGYGSIGPPAWNDKTKYFFGDVETIERTANNGVRIALTGTWGPKILKERRAAVAFVEVRNGRVAVSGLPDGYSVGFTIPTKPGSSLQIFPAPVVTPTP